MVTAEQRGAEIGGATMYGREFGPAGPLGRVLTNSAKGNSMSASAESDKIFGCPRNDAMCQSRPNSVGFLIPPGTRSL